MVAAARNGWFPLPGERHFSPYWLPKSAQRLIMSLLASFLKASLTLIHFNFVLWAKICPLPKDLLDGLKSCRHMRQPQLRGQGNIPTSTVR